MKHLVERMISAVLAAALVFCAALPVWAAEGDTGIFQDITVSAVLDKEILTKSTVVQTVTLTIKTSNPVSINYLYVELDCAGGIAIESISGADEKIPLEPDNYENDEIIWNSTGGLNVEGVTNLVTVTFKVPANTEAGIYKIGAKNVSMSNFEGDSLVNDGGIYTTLTINEATAAPGYTAGVSVKTENVSVDDTAEVSVSIGHSSETEFAAGEVVLEYSNDILEFNKVTSSKGEATVKDENGKLTIEDYGAEKPLGDSVYKVAFTPKQAGPATVTLTSAAFVNKADAAKSDLIPAAISTAKANFTVAKQRYAVKLPEGFTGEKEAVDGEKYTFRAADYEHYDYTGVTAEVNGKTVAVTSDGKGNYTIEAVNGIVVISGTRTPKKYNVTFDGVGAKDIKDAKDSATYGTDYTFTMPTAEDYAYKLEKITIGGKESKDFTVENLTSYTISGKAITGDICIYVSKTRTAVKVKVDGDGASAAGDYNIKAEPGKGYTLTIEPEAGYIYTVTATMNGQKVDLTDVGDNTYTIENVTGDIVFTVTRTVITDDVSVEKYLRVDEKNVWIVLKTTKLADEKVPTYGNENMFWSDTYDAYCYLVIAPTLELDEAESKIDISVGTATTVNYGMDVNMTNKVDASDAQLVYNMYNAEYSAFTDDMTMEKFLRADVNGDKEVNVTDAAAIIAHVLETETESQ